MKSKLIISIRIIKFITNNVPMRKNYYKIDKYIYIFFNQINDALSADNW